MKNKKIKISIITTILLIIYAYTLSIQAIPENITIIEGEKINLKTIIGTKRKPSRKKQCNRNTSTKPRKNNKHTAKKQ